MKNSRPQPSLLASLSRRRIDGGSAFRSFNSQPSTLNPVRRRGPHAFTLIELLVVIAIIAILIGLLFPAFKSVQDQAKKTQAKNDVMQIVTAVNAFYTEYGQYPYSAQGGDDSADYFTANDTDRKNLFDELRVPFPAAAQFEPQRDCLYQPPAVKNDTAGQRRSGVGGTDGWFMTHGAIAYRVRMDNNYNGLVTNPYTANAGFRQSMPE